jgi:hypothetical protein
MYDHLKLLHRTHLLANDRQYKFLFLFQVVVLVDPQGHDFAKQSTPDASRDRMVPDLLQIGLDFLYPLRQARMGGFVFSGLRRFR